MRPDIDKKVDATLESLTGIQRAEPQPFFYTRLLGRLQRSEKTSWETIGSFLARPIVAIAGICIILILNVTILLNNNKSKVSIQAVTNQNEQLVTDNEYVIASNSSFDYENIYQQ